MEWWVIYFSLGEGLPSYDNKIAVEYSIDNEIIWSTSDTLLVHHDMIKLSNGNYMVLTNETRDGPIPLGTWTPMYEALGFVADGVTIEFPWEGDRIVELDKDSGEVLWTWSVFDYFSMDDFDSLGGGWDIALDFFKYDWTHCNSISFDEGENTILLSSRHLSRITKIDYSTGEIVWNMGRQMSSGDVDFGTDLCFSYQHHITKMDNGNLLFLDNGNNSVYYCNTEFSTTRALEIEISELEGSFSAEIIWEHVLPENLAGRFMGSCERLPNGNTLFTPGGISPGIIGKAFEVSPENEVVWEMEIEAVVTNRIFRIPGLYAQKFSILQPNFVWYLPSPTIYLAAGENTVTYTIYNEGNMDEIYNYEFQDNGIWFDDVFGTINITAGTNVGLEFTGTVFNEQYPHTLSLTVTPYHAPELVKTVVLSAWFTNLSLNEEEFLGEFSFLNSYPNPFNSSTIIEYYLPHPSEVEFKIFDLTGRVVDKIESNWVNSGNHRFIWSPENLTTGVYVIQCKIKGPSDNIEKILTQKLIFMK